MRPVGRFRVPADHPCLPGHFPGRPVVPGVVLLDEALALVLAALGGGRRVAGMPSVKFTAPVLPGDEVRVACGPEADGRVAFSGDVGGREALRGTLLLGPAP